MTQKVVATAAATISGISDVMNDQGGAVRLVFGRSPFDYLGSGRPITGYQVYRRAIIAAAAVTPPLSLDGGVDPDAVQSRGWDYVTTVPATTEDTYQVTVQTFADSNASGFHRAVLFVRAATATPGVFYDSAPDSGYSVDNLPPIPPAPFAGRLRGGRDEPALGRRTPRPTSGTTASTAAARSSFVPGPTNLIATRPDTGYVDVGPAGSYYKLSAVDVNGNESGFAVLTPEGTVDVIDGAPLAFALEGVRPNPTTASRMAVTFALPTDVDARLELIDVRGRVIASRDVGALGAGRHVVDLARERRLAAGVYLVRLTQGGQQRTTRAVVLD